jgi:hypothetical protein
MDFHNFSAITEMDFHNFSAITEMDFHNFSAITEMDIHQFFGYYWDGFPPIFMLVLRWISTNFYATTVE